MFVSNKLAAAVRLAVLGVASAAFIAPVTAAEEAAVTEAESVTAERIQVTGSRIKRTDMETASPVSIISADDIKAIGFTRVEDILNSMPQLESANTSFVSNGASPTATLDLRGLGQNRTLVLVNGRRLQPGGLYTQAGDLNNIPVSLIKRVEVMTGGGASAYGADAVAGVVNFVLDDKFEGFRIDASASGYQHNNDNKYIQGLMDDAGYEYPTGSSGIDGEAFTFDVTVGGEFAGGKGHVVAYAGWTRNNELKQGARDYSSCALNSSGTSCGGSGTAEIPNFYVLPIVDGEEDWSQYQYWTLDTDSSFIESVDNYYNYAPINHFMRPTERWTMGAIASYEINEHAQPYLEVSFMNNNTSAQIAESGTFFSDYTMSYDNPLLNDTQVAQLQEAFGDDAGDEFSVYIGKRNTEGGARTDQLENTSFRAVLGSEGEINDTWTYDVNFQYGQTTSTSTYINDFYQDALDEALYMTDSGCEDDCIPYEVFTYQGVTEEAADSIAATAIQRGITSQIVISGYVSGEFDYNLPTASSPIAAVFGAEYRDVDFERVSDYLYEEGLLIGQGGPSTSLEGGYDVSELFAEASLPLVEDKPFAEALILDLGYRWSDYSTAGSDTTYKVQLDWTPIDAWKVRASFNRASRAPNVSELFTSQSIGLWSGSDGCTGETPTYTEAQCANTGVTSDQYGTITESPAGQYNSLTGGNTELVPETADTLTIGLVAEPIEGLNFTIDYWNITMDKVIGTIGSQLILDTCAESGLFCENVNRASSGSLWLSDSGYITNLTDNVGSRHWRGVDISTNYALAVLGGEMDFSLTGSYNLKKEYEPVTGLSDLTYDCSGEISTSCYPQPKWRHTASVDYSQDTWWAATARWRYFSKVDYNEGTDTVIGDGIGSYSYFDMIGTVYPTDNLTLRAGINNIFDKEPPMMGNTLSGNANTTAGFYDVLGRYAFVKATFSF